jgi:hypothetical protein
MEAKDIVPTDNAAAPTHGAATSAPPPSAIRRTPRIPGKNDERQRVRPDTRLTDGARSESTVGTRAVVASFPHHIRLHPQPPSTQSPPRTTTFPRVAGSSPASTIPNREDHLALIGRKPRAETG